MKTKLLLLAFILLVAMPTLAQKNPSPLIEMVETEYAFAQAARDKTVRDAFMEFIADDGILFRSGAVNGKQWMTEHPVPPTTKHQLLAWQPTFAGMARAGDLGFTTGPWEYKEDINDVKVSGFGHFVTLWKKQANGAWRFVVDLGISHPESGGPLNNWKPQPPKTIGLSKLIDVAKETETLIERDRSYADSAAKQSLAEAFQTYASSSARLYLPQSLPLIGRDASVAALIPLKNTTTYKVITGDVSKSGDLGYIHGTFERSSANDSKKIEHGSYVRIWQKAGNVWQIVIDVTNIAQ
jgi:ketosteroid isomerase-like protein